MNTKFDALWDESPVDITKEANDIWSIANKLRNAYMPDHYGDVIIPMTVLRRFECTLEATKEAVIKKFEENPNYPDKGFRKLSGYQFYNTSRYDLRELCNDPDALAENFKAYINSFSVNVKNIFIGLELEKQIDTMNKNGCLYSVVKAFSEYDLSPATFDSIKMGYIFENLIGRFYQNIDAGQYYTGRDIIKMLVAILISEGCDDIFDNGKVVTICDQACGTGGMLSTAYTYIKHYNPNADVRLFGQEVMPTTYAVGLAEMLIKGQDGKDFVNVDTFKTDAFPTTKMRFLLENPPFGSCWGGKDAKEGQEEAVVKESKKEHPRWLPTLPAKGDSQMIFLQSAIAKMDDNGRACIISDGSPLFTGNTTSGESQIRRYLLEHDLIEAIIAMPTDLFYNTGIQTYVWVLSKAKRTERKGKVQLIDASGISHKLRKPLGYKRNEFLPEDRSKVVQIYQAFEESEVCKIFDYTEFLYREYTVMQPLQRSYAVTEERIEDMLSSGVLKTLYDESKVAEFESNEDKLSAKDKAKRDKFRKAKPVYDGIIQALRNNTSEKKYLSPKDFLPVLTALLSGITADKKLIAKIADGLSLMDKSAEIQHDKKGETLYDKTTADTELVRFDMDIEDYMASEVLPHVPDAKYFYEDKIGAEIPFTRYFYQYEQPEPSEQLEQEFIEIEKSVSARIAKLFSEV